MSWCSRLERAGVLGSILDLYRRHVACKDALAQYNIPSTMSCKVLATEIRDITAQAFSGLRQRLPYKIVPATLGSLFENT